MFEELIIPHLVVWGASLKNFSRPEDQVSGVLYLFKLQLRQQLWRKERVRVHIRGVWGEFCSDRATHEMADMVEKKTSHYQEHHLTVLFGYNSALDIEQATQQLHNKGIRPTMELIRQHMWTAHLPKNVDLVVRTAVEGDPHDSEPFLSLERENSQLVNSAKCWPDFSAEDMRSAVVDFSSRERRMGL